MRPVIIPPVIGWALVALGGAAVVKLAAKEWRRINAALHPREPVREEVPRDKLPTLKRDPKSGEYRPD